MRMSMSELLTHAFGCSRENCDIDRFLGPGAAAAMRPRVILIPSSTAPPAEAPAAPAPPPARKRGRRKKTEKDSATRVIAALTLHHGYEGGGVTNPEPATNRGLAKRFDLAANSLSRFLRDQFPKVKSPDAKYKAACRNGTIGGLLVMWNRESVPRFAELLPHETNRNGDR